MLSEVLAAIVHRLSEEYARVEFKSEEAKKRMLQDVALLNARLGPLSESGKSMSSLETLVKDKPTPRRAIGQAMRGMFNSGSGPKTPVKEDAQDELNAEGARKISEDDEEGPIVEEGTEETAAKPNEVPASEAVVEEVARPEEPEPAPTVETTSISAVKDDAQGTDAVSVVHGVGTADMPVEIASDLTQRAPDDENTAPPAIEKDERKQETTENPSTEQDVKPDLPAKDGIE